MGKRGRRLSFHSCPGIGHTVLQSFKRAVAGWAQLPLFGHPEPKATQDSVSDELKDGILWFLKGGCDSCVKRPDYDGGFEFSGFSIEISFDHFTACVLNDADFEAGSVVLAG